MAKKVRVIETRRKIGLEDNDLHRFGDVIMAPIVLERRAHCPVSSPVVLFQCTRLSLLTFMRLDHRSSTIDLRLLHH